MLGADYGCIGGGSDSREEEQLFQSHAGYFTSFAGIAMVVLGMHTLIP